MTANQYRSALDKLGLTQAGAAEFLGVSIRTSHGYANGVPIPEGYAKLLRLMVRLMMTATIKNLCFGCRLTAARGPYQRR